MNRHMLALTALMATGGLGNRAVERGYSLESDALVAVPSFEQHVRPGASREDRRAAGRAFLVRNQRRSRR